MEHADTFYSRYKYSKIGFRNRILSTFKKGFEVKTRF